MSTIAIPHDSPVTPAAIAVPPEAVATVPDEEIRVYGHTNMLYWWPVWLVGFLMALLTYHDGHVMAVVPAGTKVEPVAVEGQSPTRDALVPPPGQTIPPQPKSPPGQESEPRLLVAASNNYGVIFVMTVLLVVVITNVTVRGLSSVIVIAMLIILTLVLAQFRLWDDVLAWVGGLDIRMNAGGYLAFAIPLFLVWLFTVFVYDRYTYIVVTRGQIRIRESIGDGEIAVDTAAVYLEKRRNDFFRHWLLGFGSGDLHVKTGGVANREIDLSNVAWIGTKLNKIQDLIREKEVAPQSDKG